MHTFYWNKSELICSFFLALEKVDHGKYLELKSDMGYMAADSKVHEGFLLTSLQT